MLWHKSSIHIKMCSGFCLKRDHSPTQMGSATSQNIGVDTPAQSHDANHKWWLLYNKLSAWNQAAVWCYVSDFRCLCWGKERVLLSSPPTSTCLWVKDLHWTESESETSSWASRASSTLAVLLAAVRLLHRAAFNGERFITGVKRSLRWP